MSQQDNLATTQKMGEAINSGRFEILTEVMASDVVDHDPAPDQGPGPQGFVQFFEKLHSAFPDLQMDVDQMVSDDDNVALAYTLAGTHRGDFMGVAATGTRIKARGVQIARFENGKITERWGSSNELGILKQLGAGLAGDASTHSSPRTVAGSQI